MSKNILCLGSRNKADYLLFIAHVISSLEKRVLIVDFTKTEVYRHGYTRLKDDEHLFDYQGIDILAGAKDVEDAKSILKSSNERFSQYDVVLYDVDSLEMIDNNWGQLQEVMYMGDFDRVHLTYDAKMIDAFINRYPEEKLRRITFGTKYKINENTLESFLTKEVKWNSVHIIFEVDESVEELRLEMQHQLTMPFKHINSNHREYIVGLVSEFFVLHVGDIKDALKGGNKGIFGSLFKRSKDKKSKQLEIHSNLKEQPSEIILLDKLK